MAQMKELANKIESAYSIVVLTGAGVSTASGIPDFRSSQGVWTYDRSREYYMSSEYFYKDPVDFWAKYKDIFRLKLLKNYEPNSVHTFLRNLELSGKQVSIITQNVDGLHATAGNEDIIEYHGNLNTATCPHCQSKYALEYVMKHETPYCDKTGCGDVLKPDIVLFGDPITKHEEAEQRIRQSELVLVMGTSLLVTPFNILPDYAAFTCGLPMAIMNREATPKDYLFDFVIHDDLVGVVKHLSAWM
ncbi:NAD-dependent protein deacylase [Aquibacillus koreensis]|uniref:protein acetyllysine N-acetyltransferase n=1 Tax=Aquibacillus koreensis TaxID=279446 RepID=A0A9X4AIN1_9BACI|nr:NAD-dependent protein deacylase [Aquibacillus koreensis]MCT2538147.1 NAD-dependent protein deacylase [Aquibacillus koreensis]MDC3420909.1 NAD-dependent protein deacylase [Aquibacillus koreensis]